jgi:digalactosyldiacylglycerol synthase
MMRNSVLVLVSLMTTPTEARSNSGGSGLGSATPRTVPGGDRIAPPSPPSAAVSPRERAKRLLSHVMPRERAECILSFVKQRPHFSLGVVVLSVLLQAHARIQIEKRRALTALRRRGRSTAALNPSSEPYGITIVTTAALPWKTGTAVNALLRAAALADVGHHVTLVVPWIHPSEQQMVFPSGRAFGMPEEQEAYMRDWLAGRQRAAGGTPHAHFEVRFYPARYDVARGSILPLGDLTRWTSQVMGACAHDLCVLEEPEHLNWYHGGRNWRRRFKLVVGVVHTNYLQYARMYQPENTGIVCALNQLVCRAYCDTVIKLSDSLQPLPRSIVCNVHGVRSEFIEVGRRAALAAIEPPSLFGFRRKSFEFTHGAYFIGKLLWAKGHRLLIDYLRDEGLDAGEGHTLTLIENAQRRYDVETHTRVDVFGDGDDASAIKEAATASKLNLHFPGARDHADPTLHGYKVFVNPSQTEVLSTTTAEALAMGKFVVIERHPSNEFFYPFANVRTYSTPAEFRAALRETLASMPAPLSAAESRALSWAGATERFLGCVDAAVDSAESPRVVDELAHLTHGALSWHKGYLGDWLKQYIFESGPVSRQRWLHSERRYRLSTSVTEVVDKSVTVSPAVGHEYWRERYGDVGQPNAGSSYSYPHKKQSHSSWTAIFLKKGDRRGM